METTIQKIDLTPTWRQAAKLIALGLENGTEQGKDIARSELNHMADIADRYVELSRLLIDDQRREDILVNALEGGSNYWYWIPDSAVNLITEHCDDKKQPLSIMMWSAIKNGAIIPIHDYDDKKEKIGEISLNSIANGEYLMLTKHKHIFTDIVSENDDAGTADVWFQLCSLGEIVYG